MLSPAQIIFQLGQLVRGQWVNPPVIRYEGQVIYRLPPPLSDKPSCLMFTQPKSGSKMVRGILRELAKQSGLQPTGPGGAFFKAGIPRTDIPASTSAIFRPSGYFYHFSNVPTEFDIPIEGPTLVHVRDIRDVLVSKYYSLRDSHPEPGDAVASDKKQAFLNQRKMLSKMDVDQGVLRLATQGVADMMKGLRLRASRKGAMLTRYEDMVYRKEEWASDVCRHFDWDRSKSAVACAVAPFDVFPEGERTDRHVRQVHPGNFRKKLKPETVEHLNETFRAELEFFGYPAQ
jgi:hypothetical protein